MRIGYDIRPFLKQETGVGVYFKNLLVHLVALDKENEYFLFSSSLRDRFPASKLPQLSKVVFKDFQIPVRVMDFCWYKLGWPPLDFFFGRSLDLTHSPTPLLLPTKGKKVVTVYDLFFLEQPHLADRQARKSFARKIAPSLQAAEGIVTISHFTRKQLMEQFALKEEKVRVVYLGLNPMFREQPARINLEKTKKKLGLPSSFILFVGAVEPRKNLMRLVDALSIIHQRFDKIVLVIAGREGLDSQQLKDKIRDRDLTNWVKILGYVSEAELSDLYNLATVLAFPSLCEGFGLPLAEAMACGLPLVVSQTGALPEVAGDAALYFDPFDPEEMAEKLIQVLQDDHLRQGLISAGKIRVKDFDWGKTAAETLDFYRQITG